MELAANIWKLVRDILLVLSGIACLLLAASNVTEPDVALILIPTAGGLCTLPVYLREREHARKRGDDRNER